MRNLEDIPAKRKAGSRMWSGMGHLELLVLFASVPKAASSWFMRLQIGGLILRD
jgi:hypothetical protein